MATAQASIGKKAVARWIYIGVFMLLVQVILGGITRLTGSGLSITEWNVVTGALPPLSEAQWDAEFVKYQATPQYQLLNTHFTLSDFKFIFFWEWFHRFWARLIGVVFIVGFVYLLAKRYLHRSMVSPLLILFFLGAAQGAVGWIMVKSGLTGDAVYVKPTRLAAHFVFALVLISYAWWFALQLSIDRSAIVYKRSIRSWIWPVLVLLFFQLIYGALMAGHKAAAAAPTWPTINGDWFPVNAFNAPIKLIEDQIAVHFIHRALAYALLLVTAIWSIQLFRVQTASKSFRKNRLLPLLLLSVQALLGILTVLSSTGIVPAKWVTFDWLAQLHQIVGMLFLLSVITMLYLGRSTGKTGD